MFLRARNTFAASVLAVAAMGGAAGARAQPTDLAGPPRDIAPREAASPPGAEAVPLAADGAAAEAAPAPPADGGQVAPLPVDAALRFAENAFVYGDYVDVVSTLEPAVADPGDAEPSTMLRAYTLLGTAAHFVGRGDLADAAFLAALRIEPRHRLDPLVVPPRVIERFDAVRAANAAELDERAAALDERVTIYIQRDVYEQSRLVSIAPFGYGFLSSGRRRTGVVYLATQAVTGATMAGLYFSNELARDADGFFANASRARARGTAQQISAGLFSSLLLANIIHGARAHRRAARVEYRMLPGHPDDLAPPDDPPVDAEPDRRPTP
jgi:hypothetical protein